MGSQVKRTYQGGNMRKDTERACSYDDRMQMLCSWCGHQDLQLLEPEVHIREDDGSSDSPLRNRGSWVDIAAVCEDCLRTTSLVVGFHKGSIQFRTYQRTSRVDDEIVSRGGGRWVGEYEAHRAEEAELI